VPPDKTRSVSPSRRWVASAPQQQYVRPEGVGIPVQAMPMQKSIPQQIQPVQNHMQFVTGQPPASAVSYVPPPAQQVAGPRMALSAVPVPVYKWAAESDAGQRLVHQYPPQMYQATSVQDSTSYVSEPMIQESFQMPRSAPHSSPGFNTAVEQPKENVAADSEFMRLLDSLEVRVDLMAQMQHTRNEIQARTQAFDDQSVYSGVAPSENNFQHPKDLDGMPLPNNVHNYIQHGGTNGHAQSIIPAESAGDCSSESRLVQENRELWGQLAEQRECISQLTAEMEDMRSHMNNLQVQSGNSSAELRSQLQASEAEVQQLKQLIRHEQQTRQTKTREWEAEKTKLQAEILDLAATRAPLGSSSMGAASLPTTPVLPIPKTQEVLLHNGHDPSLPKIQPFSRCACGVNVALSEDGYIAKRTRGCRQSVLIGSTPLARQKDGWYFEVEIRETVEGWVGGVGIGVTTTSPGNLRRVPDKAWRMPNTYIIGYWGCVFLDGQERRTSWKPDLLQAGSKVGLLISESGGSGGIRVFVDGSLVVYIEGALGSHAVPTTEFYPVVDVFAATLAVALQPFASPPPPPWPNSHTHPADPGSPVSSLHHITSLPTQIT